MEELPLRDLRNHASAILRRVEAGERFTVTVDRRPVAALVPLTRRRQWVPASAVWDRIADAQADASLTRDLDEIFEDRVADL